MCYACMPWPEKATTCARRNITAFVEDFWIRDSC